ncbi:FimV/HubP family polar landmark protein [Dyella acidiphila]|uniref:Fimbrial protein FimV n=1 Tax=Dyella acidiphila TaxID=2775866 RepID=A0ABR9GFU6_9GAMM|nr:FimV/HubP family polar landmark protein [Dyella acidiphila]MBE1162915.1 fimbrial protein FimV [Dyella acidiphila]
MNRSLKLSILMALALGSTQAAAVELGQAHVKSALGQPLLVEIPVTQASQAELESLSAQLASNDAFAKTGSERPTVALQFSVVDEGGHKVIRVTSSAPVSDPYLDLLMEVTSTAGSSVREFAILLDPPGKSAQSVQSATSSAPSHRHAPSSGSTAAAPAGHQAASNAAPAQHAVGLSGGQFGPVEKGATLSHVAAQTAPTGVDTNQMMLALKAANPDAFYRDNINALKAGAILRLPSRDDAMATAAAAAAATVRQQNSDWRNGTVSAPVAVAAGGTRANSSVAPTQSSKADKLALVPAAGEGQSAGGANGKANAAIRQELQRSQETLSSLQQQSGELESRLKDLEDLNGKNQRLLSLKDNEIADLQKQLADARKSAGMPAAAPVAAAPAPTPAPVAAPAPAKPAQPAAAASTPAETAAQALAAKPAASTSAPGAATVTTPLSAPAKPKPAAHPPVHHTPPPELPWYMQTWAMAVGAGVIVLALLALFARRGKSGAKPAKSKAAPADKGSLADRFGTVDVDNLDGAHGSDPDQDELLDQLAEHPDDIASHLELVSLYYMRRDVEHFEAAAEAMHAHITDADQPEWQDVMHMGQDLAPGHPLFTQAAIPPSGHDEHSPLHHFDLDSYGEDRHAADEPAAPRQAPPPLPSKVSEYHFDFDLTPHHAEPAAPAVSQVTPPKHEEEPVSTWQFDEPAQAAHETQHDSGHAAVQEDEFGELNDDPIDTKLDLARAYLDMGDPDGARAMLEEVLHEGSQMQRDVAQTLMAKIR